MNSKNIETLARPQADTVIVPSADRIPQHQFVAKAEIAVDENQEAKELQSETDVVETDLAEADVFVEGGQIPEDYMMLAQAGTGEGGASASSQGAASAEAGSFWASQWGMASIGAGGAAVGFVAADDDDAAAGTSAMGITQNPGTGFTADLAGTDGADVIAIDFTTTSYVDYWNLSVDGMGGNDSIVLDIEATSFYSNNFYFDGGDGADTIDLDFDLNSTGYHDTNVITMYGGTGNDRLSVDFGATDAVTYVYSSYSNEIYQYGEAGDDNIHFGYNMTDVTVDYISNNDIYQYGGDGADTLDIDYNIGFLYTSMNYNYWEQNGDAGNDSLTFALAIDGFSTGSHMSSNEVYQSGGDGNDTMLVDFDFVDMNPSCCGFYSNDVTMYGDAGDDSMTFAWAIDGYTASHMSYNDFYQYGGTGNDTMVMDLDFTNVNPTCCYFYSTDFYMEGNAGNDSLAIDVDLVYTATTWMAFSSTDYTLNGGDGADTLTFDMQGSVGDLYYNYVDMYGGAGDDILNFNMDVSATCCNSQYLTFDGGAGADVMNISFNVPTSTATTFYLSAYADIDYNALADMGDTINFTGFAEVSSLDLNFENAAFATGLAAGQLLTGNFVSGADAVAVDGDDYFIYQTNTFELYYDDDGSGANAAQLVADFNVDVGLVYSDINMV